MEAVQPFSYDALRAERSLVVTRFAALVGYSGSVNNL